MLTRHTISQLATALSLLCASTALAQFTVDWFTVDGGGAMNRTDGQAGGFALSGTAGQPDAGPGAPGMSGGGFELTGGFWFARVPGDCNSDDDVNLLDYADFPNCLTGPGGGSSGSGCACFDLDTDTDIDVLDFAELQNAFDGA